MALSTVEINSFSDNGYIWYFDKLHRVSGIYINTTYFNSLKSINVMPFYIYHLQDAIKMRK